MKRFIAVLCCMLLCGCSDSALSLDEYAAEVDAGFVDYLGAEHQLYDAMTAVDAQAAEKAAVACIKVLERMEALDAPRELSKAEERFDEALNDEMEYIERTCEFIVLRAEGKNTDRLNELAEINKEYLSENRIGTAYSDMLSAIIDVRES